MSYIIQQPAPGVSVIQRQSDGAWIPQDERNHDYRDYLEWVAAGNVADVVLPPAPVPDSISRRQCARQMLDMGMITGEEALAMTRTGAPPAMVTAIFDQFSPEDRVIAEIDFAADTYLRSNPLLVNLMLATGASADEIDDFFRAAAQL